MSFGERGLPFQPTLSALCGLKAHYSPNLEVQLKRGTLSKIMAEPFVNICWLLASELWPPKRISADFARDVAEQVQSLLYGINENISCPIQYLFSRCIIKRLRMQWQRQNALHNAIGMRQKSTKDISWVQVISNARYAVKA